MAQWENPAKGYQLRYLARSAVRLQAGPMAVQLIHRALAAHWRLLAEQPRRTLMTLIAAYMLWLLPQSIYAQIEGFGSQMVGMAQKRRIVQE
jgi:hypothetical protein